MNVVTKPQTASVLGRTRSVMPSLPPIEVAIAEHLLANPLSFISSDITRIASELGTSPTSVIRFSQRLGFKGFRQLKTALALELGNSETIPSGDLTVRDAPIETLQKIVAAEVRALLESIQLVDPAGLAEAVDTLYKAEHIDVFGTGSVAHSAWFAYYRLLRLQRNVSFIQDPIFHALSAVTRGPKDATLVMDMKGTHATALEVARQAKQRGIKVIALAAFAHSPLEGLADICLIVPLNFIKLEGEVIGAGFRSPFLAVVYALYMSLIVREGEPGRDTILQSAEVENSTLR